MKFIFAFVGFGIVSCQQPVSLLSMLARESPTPVEPSKEKPALPANCARATADNVCEECVEGYDVSEGSCVLAVDGGRDGDFSAELQDGFLPCKGRDVCGEAQGFQNEKDFADFVSKYAGPSQPTQPTKFIKTPQVMDIAVRPATIMPAFSGASLMAQSSAMQSFSPSSAKMMAPTIAPSLAPAPAPKPASGRDFSGTNNQVDGVDEADLLKTDGTYIYTISNKVLSIILAYPADKATLISKISLKDVNAEALFIEENFLSVFGTDYSSGNAFTFIRIYDIRNRARPFLTRTYKVAGRYTNGRKTNDGFVYLITNQSLYTRVRPWYDFGFGTTSLSYGSIFRYPGLYSRPQLTNIISFNLRKPTSSERKIVSICGETSSIMYMSERAIYLTSSSWVNGQDYTNIRKIFVWRKNIVPFADGKVKGSVNNQFSLDEYGPYLRVAATLNNSGKSSNSVYSLGFYLQPYGALNGIAPGQKIFSARYVDRKLYLVTFRQVDPFFVISLANHKKPKILGQLKVPGFSRYLHPYDEDTIIGLGRQADANGRQQGLKISLFDVSDVENPTELAKLEVQEQYASSNAEWEHKAFLFSAEKNLLVIPTTMNSADVKFNGALTFFISKEKKQVLLKVAIDHMLTEKDNFSERGVERSLYIEDLLYTKSKCLLRINKINKDFDQVKDIKIPCDQSSEPIYRIPKLPPRIPIEDPIFITDPIVMPRFEPQLAVVDQKNAV